MRAATSAPQSEINLPVPDQSFDEIADLLRGAGFTVLSVEELDALIAKQLDG